MLRSVGWLRTDVSRLSIGPTFKGEVSTLEMGCIGIPETSVVNHIRCVTSQKTEEFRTMYVASNNHSGCSVSIFCMFSALKAADTETMLENDTPAVLYRSHHVACC